MRPNEEWLHSIAQLEFMRAVLGSGEKLGMRDAHIMALLLTRHADPRASRFIEFLRKNTTHPDGLRRLDKLEQVNRFLQSLPDLEALRADPARVEALYRTEGFFLEEGQKRPRELLLVFATRYNNFGISNLALLAAVRQFGVSLLLLKDCTANNFLGGVAGLGNDLDQTLAEVERFIDQQRIERVAITGFSSGGFAGAYASCRLASAAFLGFSIPTDFSDEAPEGSDFFMKPEIRGQHPRHYRVNLARLMLGEQDPPRRRLLVGRNCPADVDAARTMQGIPRLEVLELADAAHDTPESLIATGGFMEQFDWLLND